jgi:TonB family protein
MSRPELHPDDAPPDPVFTLERHIAAGFQPDLALDLVLNELVVSAAKATGANAAALALLRGNEMVCRAATGHLAPDLGVPINTRDGLSGACLRTRQPQLSVDTEFDPRVDPVISQRLGIRSILIVPVFETNRAQFAGILEVFSSSPAVFSHANQKRLEGLAEQCTQIRQAALEISQREPEAVASGRSVSHAAVLPETVPSESVPSETVLAEPAVPEEVVATVVPPEMLLRGFNLAEPLTATPPPASRPPYEVWTLVLASLLILATVGVSFLIGSRVGWLSPSTNATRNRILQPTAAQTPEIPPASGAANSSSSRRVKEKTTVKPTKAPSPPLDTSPDELVVYEKGKVIFRLKPGAVQPTSEASDTRARHGYDNGSENASDKTDAPRVDMRRPDRNSVVAASSTKKIPTSPSVWLAPAQADERLLSRTEPDYPAEARAAHRAGNVVLEIQVAEDGSVANTRTLSGDPMLAAAAAEAVRNWRYQPYRQHDRPAQFQTDVTLRFALPN